MLSMDPNSPWVTCNIYVSASDLMFFKARGEILVGLTSGSAVITYCCMAYKKALGRHVSTASYLIHKEPQKNRISWTR